MSVRSLAKRKIEAARGIAGTLIRDPFKVPRLLNIATGQLFDRAPIVIGGCGRSGTTVLVSILSAHPSIVAIPYETRAFTPTLYSDHPDPSAPFDIWRLYVALGEVDVKESHRRWCEKTPKNVKRFGSLLRHFERRVRLVHMVRDGRDVVTSCHPSAPEDYWVEPERWVEDVRAGLQYREDDCVYTLRYEDLIRTPSSTVESLGEFLHEDFRGLADSWQERAEVQYFGPHKRHVARPLNEGAIGRWKDPEHQERVKELLSTPGAQELLAELGYVRIGS